MSRSSPPGTVLVLRFSSAGDIVLASPAIDALHKAWPGTRIVYAVKGPFADLVRHHPAVSEVIETREGESFLGYLARLKAAKPDVVLDLHGKMRSRMIRWLLPRSIPKVVWNKRPWEDNLPVRLGLRPYKAAMLISDRYHAAVEMLVGGKVPYRRDAPLPRPRRPGNCGRGADEGRTRSGEADARDEPRRELGDQALARRPVRGAREARGGPGDAGRAHRQPIRVPLAETVRAAVPNAANLCGALPLKALGGVISRCTAFVANDSGPMHMARALGVPTLTFFGSTDPDQFLFDGHHAMFAGVECSPCHFYGRRKCPKGHFRCMLDLSSDQAWGALTTLVARKGERVPFVRG